ncbi:GNAT family N-acetyltransferase [Brevibacillus sp. HB1.2]|uniref:GNAT family N-acetyltransferase n=1 Tax=Brevibacillus sp. HB1.2 TaxID=2738807 RepID=UPI00157740CA|nr:GNAT family N-acetyltransferase [Brevibacillus sp. HB1.2]NTU23512.1 GNAT family N-acetyltransferase [Brevibacillus sp. HB1.2]
MSPMVFFKKAVPANAEQLTQIAVRCFAEDVQKYGEGPVGHDQPDQHVLFMQKAHYYTILLDDQIVGGFCLLPVDHEHLELGIIYVDPDKQNLRIGSQTMQFMEAAYPHIKKWTLDTGYEAERNQYFYEKCGYKKVGETAPNAANGFYKFRYEKRIPK